MSSLSSTRREALIVTVGILALLLTSNPSPGAPDGGDSTADARANAKTALMLALGELQKCAGPDQRVTARADILAAAIANPHLTGVWDSWEIKATAPPLAADYEKPAKDAKFRGWLVSNPDAAAARQVGFASQALVDPATLWGAGTLGATAPSSSHVSAAKVPVASPPGAYAWAVLDEGVKARINTPYIDGASSVAAKTLQLGSGERPGVEFITGLGGLSRPSFETTSPDFADFVKGIGDANFGLTAERLAPGSGEVLKTLTHDVSLHSTGLFTDTARGGFKQDFHLMTNSASLPAPYLNRSVYASRLGMSASTVRSDPTWASLRDFALFYRDKLNRSGGVPYIKSQIPSGWVASTGTTPYLTINRAPPAGVVLLPTIAKVQMVFSLVAEDIYQYTGQAGDTIPASAPSLMSPEADYFRGTPYQYLLFLQYTPAVTLHNPYNVAIECSNLRVEFANVPFAMTVYRNGIAQNTGLAPLDQLFYTENESGTVNKRFGMNLKTKASDGTPGSSTFRLLPGEVKIFSPYLDPNHTWSDDLRGSRIIWDFDSKDTATTMTMNIDAIPGWRGDGFGFVADWLNPAPMRIGGPDKSSGRWAGTIGLARDDQIHVVFAPLSVPGLSTNKFFVTIAATASDSGQPVTTHTIAMDYESPSGLQNFLLGTGGTLRFPKTGTINTLAILNYQKTPLKDLTHTKPFALFTVRAKTTSGGRDSTNQDGRLATKPWCFAHANIGASSQKVASEHPANFSHEIDMQVLEDGTASVFSLDAQDRDNFISGLTANNGTRFGTQYDIPFAPIQTLASLNGANPGGSSGYLPRFAQPIGNSWAHPLMSPNNLSEANAVSGYTYLDHSFLLNLALYDGFYFSGLASQIGSFGSGRTTTTIASDFAADKPLDDPRLLLYRPNGKPASAFPGEVAKSTAYANIAAWQMMKGAFNINSTSVLAWKAMLASIHDAQALFCQIDKTAGTSTLTALTPPAANEARISRFRLPASKSAADGGNALDGYWLGPREYSDAQLQTLAENIVNQVRLRGPFLSMAELVNRRLGTGDTAQRGALQQAIDDSNLNSAVAIAANAGFEIPAAAVTNYKYANAAAGTGSSYQGAPGYLTQADLLNVLGNAATARSDTFTIRGYGEARDATGQVTASAICEAVVQRLPDWFDPADPAETAPASLTSESNKTLGRRFRVVAFRWLNADEI